MRRKNMKNKMRTYFLLAVVALAVGPPEAGISHAFGVDDEHNIEKIAIKRVQPAYPPNAQKYKIEGVVTVQVNVNSEGKVTKAEFVRGHNLFRSVSLDAAKRWEFKLSGESSLEGTIRFTFKLSQ
jgi:TonB family protein